MLNCKRRIYDCRDRDAATAYLKVNKFVESGVYSSCAKASEMVELILKGYKTQELADYFCIAYNTAKNEKRKISMELWEIFPSDFFDKLYNFKENRDYINSCLYSIENFEVKSEKFIFSEVIMKVKRLKPTDGFEVIEPSDVLSFTNEIDFLKLYSKIHLEDDLNGVDIVKVKYLLDVLDSKEGNTELRSKLLKELKGE